MASDGKPQNTNPTIPSWALSLFHLGQSLLVGGIFSLILFDIIPSVEFLLRLSFGTVPGGRVGFGVILLILGALSVLLFVAMKKMFGPIFRSTQSDTDQAFVRERRWPVVLIGTIPVIGAFFVVQTVFSWERFFTSAIYGTMVIGVILQFVARSQAVE